MNVEEIERIVKLIETTTDSDVKKILKDLLAAESSRKFMIPMPTVDPFTIPVIKKWEVRNNCPKCGLELSNVMGYCCPHNDCPTGLGPLTC